MNKLSTTLLATFIALGSATTAFAADEMKKDTACKDTMSKDPMCKDAMKKDPMAKDAMKKDSMGKGDGMMKKDEMKK